MNATQNTTEYMGTFTRPDGYFGDRRIVHLLFDWPTGKVLEAYELGFHTSAVLDVPCSAPSEAFWRMNHPRHHAAKGYYLPA